ncbi:mechanosensitive ion channel family protein [Sulfurovum sp.]|uniref:mechanosensitive ion channel family protein n=1 Tax=Sulfurovum sp. TaxID=1969726 RepID=UPI002867DD31|nr:mechanosensitive ion channel family protein [Sulfurovum sp.]
MNHYNMKALDDKMTKQFIKNQTEIDNLTKEDYSEILEIKSDHRIIKNAQKNIKDYGAVLEINADILNYLALYKNRIFRLNKYKNYGILEIALYLDNTALGHELNVLLEAYQLSIVKFILFVFITVFIYLIRTLLFRGIEFFLLKINLLSKYSKDIINEIRRPINYILIILNIELIMYIYHDFNHIELFSKIFNIAYSIFFSYIIYRILNSIASIQINDIQRSDKKIKSEMVNVTIKIINFIIMIVGLLLVLHFAGANLTTVLSGLGIGGFAVAFAARETLSNFLGTISILMSDTYSQGDWIVVDDKQGNVVEIGLRVTTLRTFDNALISIPNGIIATKDVKNWNKRTLGRRIKMSIGVKYDSTPDNLHQAIKEIREMLLTHQDIASNETRYKDSRAKKSAKLVSEEDELGIKRTLLVYLDEFSDSSINILVYCFSKKTVWQEWLATKEDVMYKIMDILEKNDLEFAFPSMSLYNEKED